MPTDTDWLDLGAEVWWRVAIPGRYPGQMDYATSSGRIISLGKERHLVEVELGASRFRHQFVAPRRLKRTETEATNDVWSPECCRDCGAQKDANGHCVEECGIPGTNLRA